VPRPIRQGPAYLGARQPAPGARRVAAHGQCASVRNAGNDPRQRAIETGGVQGLLPAIGIARPAGQAFEIFGGIGKSGLGRHAVAPVVSAAARRGPPGFAGPRSGRTRRSADRRPPWSGEARCRGAAWRRRSARRPDRGRSPAPWQPRARYCVAPSGVAARIACLVALLALPVLAARPAATPPHARIPGEIGPNVNALFWQYCRSALYFFRVVVYIGCLSYLD